MAAAYLQSADSNSSNKQLTNTTTTTEATSNIRSQNPTAPRMADSDEFLLGVADEVSAQAIKAPINPLVAAQVDSGFVGEAQRIKLRETDPTLRNSQMEQSRRLQDRATGKLPSVAEQQFAQNLDRIMKAQNAQAAGARGAQNSMLAQREATFAGQDMMQEAGRESAMLRMQEQQQAEQQLAGVLESIRGMDMTMVVKQAELDQQTNLANLNTRLETAVNNARMRQDVGITEYTTEFERQRANQSNQLQTDLANQATKLQTDVTNSRTKLEVAVKNFDALLQEDAQEHSLTVQDRGFVHDEKLQGRSLTHAEKLQAQSLATQRSMQAQSLAHASNLQAQSLAAQKAMQAADTITKMTIANEDFALKWAELGLSGNEKDREFLLKTIDSKQQQQTIDNGRTAQNNINNNQKTQLKMEAEKMKAGQPNQFETLMKNVGYGVEALGGAMQAADTVIGWFK